MTKTDDVFAQKLPRVVDFVFDERVAAVFPDMVRRSVPGYESIVALTGVIAEQHCQPDSKIYDLGCSLGASMLSAHSRLRDSRMRFIGVDNSADMLRGCEKNLSEVMQPDQFTLEQRDICEVEISGASLVILNFTLQFIEPEKRLSLLSNIYSGLNPGGVLVLSEKIRFKDRQEDRLQQTMHERFKLANGYSDLEISQKRTALENVMILDDRATHLDRLARSGFAQAAQWYQAFNFCSFVAIK